MDASTVEKAEKTKNFSNKEVMNIARSLIINLEQQISKIDPMIAQYQHRGKPKQVAAYDGEKKVLLKGVTFLRMIGKSAKEKEVKARELVKAKQKAENKRKANAELEKARLKEAKIKADAEAAKVTKPVENTTNTSNSSSKPPVTDSDNG